MFTRPARFVAKSAVWADEAREAGGTKTANAGNEDRERGERRPRTRESEAFKRRSEAGGRGMRLRGISLDCMDLPCVLRHP
jgi:hypothetical protein